MGVSLLSAEGVSTDRQLTLGGRLMQPMKKPAMKFQAQVMGSPTATGVSTGLSEQPPDGLGQIGPLPILPGLSGQTGSWSVQKGPR